MPRKMDFFRKKNKRWQSSWNLFVCFKTTMTKGLHHRLREIGFVTQFESKREWNVNVVCAEREHLAVLTKGRGIGFHLPYLGFSLCLFFNYLPTFGSLLCVGSYGKCTCTFPLSFSSLFLYFPLLSKLFLSFLLIL